MSGRLQLHGAIYRPDSFVLMLRYCANLKAMRYESTSLNRIVADKSYRVIVAEESPQVKSIQSALSDLKRPPERLQSQCNYRPFIT